MHIIRNSKEMERFLASNIDADLHHLLIIKVDELLGYEDYELGDRQ